MLMAISLAKSLLNAGPQRRDYSARQAIEYV